MNNSIEKNTTRKELRKTYDELNFILQSALLLRALSDGFINSNQATTIFKERIIPLKKKTLINIK